MPNKEMIISANAHEKKVAIVENGVVMEFYIERTDENRAVVGNVYKGKVMKVLPGMQSAFVDIGLERDAFLYVSDFFEEESDEFETTSVPSDGGGRGPRREMDGREVRDDRRRDRQPPVKPAAPRPAAQPVEAQDAPIPETPVLELEVEELKAVLDAGIEDQYERVEEPHTEPVVAEDVTVTPDISELIRSLSDHAFERVTDLDLPADPLGFEPPEDAEPSIVPDPRADTTVGDFSVVPVTSPEPAVAVPPSKVAKPKRGRRKKDEPETEPEAVAAVETQKKKPARGRKKATESKEPVETFERVVDDEGGDMDLLKEAIIQEKILEVTRKAEYETAPLPSLPEPEVRVGSLREQLAGETEFERVADEAESAGDDEAGEASLEIRPRNSEFAARRGRRGRRGRGRTAPATGGGSGTEDEESDASNPPMADAEVEEIFMKAESAEEPSSTAAPERSEESSESAPRGQFQARDRRGRDAREPRGRDNREGREPRDGKDNREGREPRDGRDNREGRELRDGRDNREGRELRDGRDNREGREPRDGRDNREGREPRDGREPRGNRDARPHRPPTITDLLREGQEVLVQIAKEPIGMKGARITSYVALPGRYLVYMPTVNHIGVSRKIPSEQERVRLKRTMMTLRERENVPGGFIVRTACENHTEEELYDDMMYLFRTWQDMRRRMDTAKPGTVVYRELDLVQRILRDHMSGEFSAIRIDNEEEYLRTVDFISRFQPRLLDRVKLYTRERPIFEEHGIQADLDAAIRPRVWLKSGGFIVINQTEALVAIDVNTGKFVGRSNRLEDTITRTNLEAAVEIVRQIRLRDLGGIIVLDFIDMEEKRNRQKVMQVLEQEIRSDRSPSKILHFNDFGLVAITRKRVRQSLERTLCEPCSYCNGAGMVKSPQTMCYEILSEAKRMSFQLRNEKNRVVTLRVSSRVAQALRSTERRVFEEIEAYLGHHVALQVDAHLHQEQYDFAVL